MGKRKLKKMNKLQGTLEFGCLVCKKILCSCCIGGIVCSKCGFGICETCNKKKPKKCNCGIKYCNDFIEDGS